MFVIPAAEYAKLKPSPRRILQMDINIFHAILYLISVTFSGWAYFVIVESILAIAVIFNLGKVIPGIV